MQISVRFTNQSFTASQLNGWTGPAFKLITILYQDLLLVSTEIKFDYSFYMVKNIIYMIFLGLPFQH